MRNGHAPFGNDILAGSNRLELEYMFAILPLRGSIGIAFRQQSRRGLSIGLKNSRTKGVQLSLPGCHEPRLQMLPGETPHE